MYPLFPSSFQHPLLKCMLHSQGLKPAPSDCRSDVLPLHQSAKVTVKDRRVVFSLFSQCFLYSTCFTCHPGNLKGTNITLLAALLLLNGERLSPGCKPVVHASCIRPCWWCYLYYGDHSFNNNYQMGCTPCSLHHSNIIL